jgi:hypothetical protein
LGYRRRSNYLRYDIERFEKGMKIYSKENVISSVNAMIRTGGYLTLFCFSRREQGKKLLLNILLCLCSAKTVQPAEPAAIADVFMQIRTPMLSVPKEAANRLSIGAKPSGTFAPTLS